MLLEQKISALQTQNAFLEETIRLNHTVKENVLRKPNADLVEYRRTIKLLEQRNVETTKQKELWQNKVADLEREKRVLKGNLVEYEIAYNKLKSKNKRPCG